MLCVCAHYLFCRRGYAPFFSRGAEEPQTAARRYNHSWGHAAAAWQYFHATHSQHPFFLPSAPTYQISLMPLTRVKFISNNASCEVKKLLHGCYILFLYCKAHILLLALFPLWCAKSRLTLFHTQLAHWIFMFFKESEADPMYFYFSARTSKLHLLFPPENIL